MAETLISVDLTQSPLGNKKVLNRWHPDSPMACWVNPGDDFIFEPLTGSAASSRTTTVRTMCVTST